MPNRNSRAPEGFIPPGFGLRIAALETGRPTLEGAKVSKTKRNLPQNSGILNS